jgi:hypothetical protein
LDVEQVNRIWVCFGQSKSDGESRKPKQSRRQLQDYIHAFNSIELEPYQQGSSVSEQPQKRLGSKTLPALATSMAHLLRAFNNGPATSTLKEARPSEQTQTNDAGTAETPTKTTATTGTSTMGWKTKGKRGGIAQIQRSRGRKE